MVVLAVAVCTKSGKALVSRQFVDISRVRIEGLLAAFPKLMGTGKQHTFIETENVRYVYQPMENLYVLILTNKSSNILEDLETLHILAKFVPEICRTLDEQEVTDKAYDLIFAFDEVISLGYKEKVTHAQIKTFLEMDSQEEKIHRMVQENKEKEAKIEAQRKISQMEKLKKPTGMGSGPMTAPLSGIGERFLGSSESRHDQADPFVVREVTSPKGSDRRPPPSAAESANAMKLKPKEASSRLMRAMEQEEDLPAVTAPVAGGAAAAPVVNREAVHIAILESVSATLANDGALRGPVQIQGELSLLISDARLSGVAIQFQAAEGLKKYNFRTHPNIDKNSWTKDWAVTVKDGKKGFPVGNPLPVLKWRLQTQDENSVPLIVSCWPTDGGDGTTVVTMEYEFRSQGEGFRLQDVTISIPIIGSAPVVGELEGQHEFDVKNHVLHWKLPVVDEENATGNMEFTIPSGSDAAGLFPIRITFSSLRSCCPLEIENATVGEEAIKFSIERFMQTSTGEAGSYSVVQ